METKIQCTNFFHPSLNAEILAKIIVTVPQVLTQIKSILTLSSIIPEMKIRHKLKRMKLIHLSMHSREIGS